MPMVDVAGSMVAYEVDGDGPGLVLVHGTGGDAESNWSEVVDRLSQRWTVVRPNYSGSGRTSDGGGVLTISMLAEQVVGAAQAAGTIPFDLVGFSLGAAVAIQIAADHPGKVRSVIPLAGFASGDDPWLTLEFRLWRDLIERDHDALARLVVLTGFSPAFVRSLDEPTIQQRIDDIIAGNDWAGMARQVDLDLRLDVRADAARITAPALVVGCTFDQMVPPSHARELAALIPGARYAELASGHIVSLENPSAFLDLIEPFLLEPRAPNR